jgi:membrane-bound ClpP family serine protease
MKRIGTMILTVILFILGIIIVFLNPINPVAISFGMFLVAVAVLNIAVQIYFPAVPSSPVELRVVERRVKPKSKSKKRVKKAKKKRKR